LACSWSPCLRLAPASAFVFALSSAFLAGSSRLFNLYFCLVRQAIRARAHDLLSRLDAIHDLHGVGGLHAGLDFPFVGNAVDADDHDLLIAFLVSHQRLSGNDEGIGLSMRYNRQ